MSPSSSSGISREEIRRQYAVACEASGSGSRPPDVDLYLAGFEEPERSILRLELEALRSSRTPVEGGTVDFPAPDAETMDHTGEAVAQSGPSVGFSIAPGGATTDFAPGDPKATTDFPAGDPRATADFQPGATQKRGKLDAIPATIGNYDILGVLGRGAMGVVYKASQRGLKRTVALKMVLSGSHADERELVRFRAEAEAVAQLQHPNIVQIYEVGESEGRPFFSLEFVEGSSLDKKIRDNPLPAREAARICQKLAEGMAYAHQRNIIHRDLKPANVLLAADGTPKISDFGLAKQMDAQDAGLTRAGTVLGTPSYMAPEQAEGKIDELGPLSDVYSLGAILYDLLTGRAPFRGSTLLETLEQVRTREPVPPLQLQPTVPRDLETICLKCLQKDRARRYASAGELAKDLERFLKGEPIQARPVSKAERVWRWCQRNPWVAGLSAAVALVVIAWAVTSSALAWGLKLQKDEADYQASVATKEKIEAVRQEGIAKEQTILAVKNEKSAKATAEETVGSMARLGETIYQRLQSKRLTVSGDPNVRQLREDVLATLRQSLQDVSAKIDKAGATPFGAPGAAQAMGRLLAKVGQGDEALKNFRRSTNILEQMVKLAPNNDQARANLGVSLLDLGDTALAIKGNAAEARDHYTQAYKLHQEILAKPRDGSFPPQRNKIILSHDAHHLGEAYLALGDPAAARRSFEESRVLRKAWADAEPKSLEARSYLMQIHMCLGMADSFLGDDKKTDQQFQEAIRLGNAIIASAPKYVPFRADLAEVQGNHGDAVLRRGKVDEARKIFQQAMDNLQFVLAKRPDDLAHQTHLALLNERLGIVSARLGQKKEAEKHFNDALQLRLELLQVAPNNLTRQAAYVLGLARAGKHAPAANVAGKLRVSMAKGVELQLQLARCLAICAATNSPQKNGLAKQAIDVVRAATTNGFKNAVLLQTDPELQPLQADPAFQKIVASVKSR